MDINEVTLLGRICSELELKQTPNGNLVLAISVVTNESYKDNFGNKQETATFHNIVLWGKLAEIINSYGKKGSRVLVKGKITTKSWEAQDGTKRYKTEILGREVILLDNRSENNSNGSGDEWYDNQVAIKKSPPKRKEEEIGIEDIPF